MHITTKRSPPRVSRVYALYWKFAAERQQILFNRLSGQPPPWTIDPILAGYRFTNAYRVCDRVSQYLIRNVQYCDKFSPQDTFFRTLLFKIFNKISTWELLRAEFGEPCIASFDPQDYGQALSQAMLRGEAIYSAAYIMPSGGGGKFERKHNMHLMLLHDLLLSRFPERLFSAPSMNEAFKLLHAVPTFGSFLAYQYVTDLNYSDVMNFTEMEFVRAGPGAKSGIKKCFESVGDYSDEDIIRWVTERQEEEFARLGVPFRKLGDRSLQLIDCQNLFCEIDKYLRVAHPEIVGVGARTRIKQSYVVNPAAFNLWLPPKWGLIVEPDQ